MRQDKGSMEENEIRHLMVSGNLNKLRLLTSTDAKSFLLAVIGREDLDAAPANFDRLISMGILFAKTEHEDLEEPVLRWLLDKPSGKRLDIAAAFLTGLWRRACRRFPVGDDKVILLLTARRGLEVDEDTEYSFIQALCEVIESDAAAPVRQRAVRAVETAAQRNFSRSLQPSVKARVDRALKYDAVS
jgi:hypothetical protein